MTGGVAARNAVLNSGNSKEDKSKNYVGYTLGLYGHTHESRVDVLQKENGKLFYAVSTKGLNYDPKNDDDKLGVSEIRTNLKGEFAEIDIDENNELSNYTLHKTEGSSSYVARQMSKDDILNKKRRNIKSKYESFGTLDYDESFKKAA